MISVVRACDSQGEFEEDYDVSPQLVQAEPVLIENLHAMDQFNREMGQKKRRAKSRDSN